MCFVFKMSAWGWLYCWQYIHFSIFEVYPLFESLAGNCPWIRIPAIVYSSHVVTTVFPIVAEIYLSDFSHTSLTGPSTLTERHTLVAVYAPFLVVPFILLFTMLFNSEYSNPNQGKQKMYWIWYAHIYIHYNYNEILSRIRSHSTVHTVLVANY